MRKQSADEDAENRREGQQANDDILGDIIHLPERDPTSVAHIASPRLVHPQQAKDFEKQVIEESSAK